MSRDDIECPEDIIPYNCSIQSNSETIHLTWSVTLPGQMSLNITYYSYLEFSDDLWLNSYITTSLLGFRSDEFIHSILEITVEPDIPTDQIKIECSIDNLENDTITVFINTSGEFVNYFAVVRLYIMLPLVPSAPIAFSIIMEYHGSMETTVTLDWDPPQGTGPEAVVDNYTISISPMPPYQQEVFIQKFNVTLAHNVFYTINLTAMNCAGESEPAILSNIGFSELLS